MLRNKASKYPHVYRKGDRWEARIKSEGVSLRMYDTEEEAHNAVIRYIRGHKL